ncbi:trigger factor [Desulfovibrio sp. ZJ200]|uniref:trigger factor n=1 Tax=Desulfovibrio sp. ZJ200 TaxID=2709792 RepID=UPI0013ECC786|nr:trigger factor [Desulfovibrio sp. ZJ200]
MEYSAEELSPVKKKVVITTEPQEVEAAIMGAVALYKTSVQLDGFRKGKVPAKVIEQRFRDKIYEEARQDLVNVHINEVMQALDVAPVSGITMGGDDTFQRGKGYTYSIEFEVLPVFDLPPYEGMEVEQEKVEIKDAEVAAVIERIRRDRAQLVPVDGKGPGVDGQVVTLDFAAYENGQPLEGIKAENFDLALGERQALEDFEKLVKTIPYGEEGEGEIHFPEDFIAKDLAGKTVTMKVKVHAVKERKLPELNDELAKSLGLGLENVDKLKETITRSYAQSRENLNRSAAQKTMLDRLLKMVDFVLPESVVQTQMNTLLADLAARLERQGKALDSLGKSPEELHKEMLPQAEELARIQVLLLSIAKKEGLDISEQEINTQIYQQSQHSGEDFKTLRESYERSGMIFILRDRLLADKAMDTIYAKAKVTEVEPKEAPTDAGKAEDPAEAPVEAEKDGK